MCGLVGIFSPPGTRIDRHRLQTMRDMLVHRGPDDAGLVVIDTTGREIEPSGGHGEGNLGLGFRRLSILDLSPAGHQPMADPTGNNWIVFNGEIYDYRELRQPLAAGGRRFVSESDTEVILALYERHGTRAFEMMNGMFALALWDHREQTLHLARDRFGIKPLYYVIKNGVLLFASEIKALLLHPAVARDLDQRAMAETFCYQGALEDRTIFRDIRVLEPGCRLAWHDGQASIERYWQPTYSTMYNNEAAGAEALRHALAAALNRQIRSDVPLGTYLSGGMDSGAVSAFAARSLPGLPSFTCGFDVSSMAGLEQFFDERPEAQAMADMFGTRHASFEITPQDLRQRLDSVVWHLEEPRAGISYQNFAMADFVRRSVTVALTGVGGDELFAGYPWRHEQVLGIADPAVCDDKYSGVWQRLVAEDRLADFFAADSLPDAEAMPSRGFAAIMSRCESSDPLERALFYDTSTFLPALLMVEDKLSMAHSLEARVPLLDNEVADVAFGVPSHLKFDGRRSKIILKSALKGILPPDALERRKQGFTPPDQTWYRGENWDFITETLLGTRFLDRGWFRRSAIKGMLDEHHAGTANHRMLIWSLLCFDRINRLLVEPTIPTAPIVTGNG